MARKIWNIFVRDIRVNMRDAISLLIVVLPLLLAVGINLITPSINDTTVNVAIVKNENPAQEAYFNDFAHVSVFDDRQGVEDRVMQRDSVLGIVEENGGYVILRQGNESDMDVDYVRLLKTLYESGASPADSSVEIAEFGRTTPPLKEIMVNTLLLLNAVLAGMIISLNIVEEKADNTVSAVNVTPTSRTAFLIGKSLSGILFSVLLTLASIAITGFMAINIGQVLLVVLATAVMSMMIGLVQGLGSDDVMEAAGSVKLMFLPMAASIVGYELLGAKWQIFLYWSPFYWGYKANDLILSQSGTWGEVLLCTGIILGICIIIYALLASRIRKGLE